MAGFARTQVLSARATAAFGAEPDIDAWANGCALNPAKVTAEQRDDPALQAARARMASVGPPGIARLTELAGMSPA